ARLVAIGRVTGAFGRLAARRSDSSRRRRGRRHSAGIEEACDLLQLAKHGGEAERKQSRTAGNHPGDNQGVAETELLDRAAKEDSQRASKQKGDPGDK